MTLPRFLPVPPDYRFEHQGALTLPPALEAVAASTLAIGKRFDGEIVSVSDIGPGRLLAATARYGHFLAERETAGVPRAVRPLAVTGVSCVEGKYVFGRRAANVLQEAGALEFLPSGGIDAARIGADGAIDYIGQLLAELEEECGVATDAVRATRLIGLVEDEDEGVIDIVCTIDLACTSEEMRAAHSQRASDEYVELVFADPGEIANWQDWPGRVGRATAAVLRGGNLIAGNRL